MTGDPIREYLAEFAQEMGPVAPYRGRVLAEVEDHLREAAARIEAAGASPHDAAVRAVKQFGSPRSVAASIAAPRGMRFVYEARSLGWRLVVAVAALAVAAVLLVVGVHAGRATIPASPPDLLDFLSSPMRHPRREEGYLAASALIGVLTLAWLIALRGDWHNRQRLIWRGLLALILVAAMAGAGTGEWVNQHAPRGCSPLAINSLAAWCQRQSAHEQTNRLRRA
ncbi:MAG: permease prefix domain 1-containing protein [Mycobacteriales bacterium]